MISQQELARRFAAGESVDSLPSASNVEAREGPEGVDYLVGYGHAIYAARTGPYLVRFDGWRGYSVSTSCQLTELRKGFDAGRAGYHVEHSLRPRVRRGQRIDADDVREIVDAIAASA